MTNNDPRQPTLRVTPGPSDINSNGHIFGGWVLSQMDIAAGIVAAREADGPVATVKLPYRATPQVHGFWVPGDQLPPPKA